MTGQDGEGVSAVLRLDTGESRHPKGTIQTELRPLDAPVLDGGVSHRLPQPSYVSVQLRELLPADAKRFVLRLGIRVALAEEGDQLEDGERLLDWERVSEAITRAEHHSTSASSEDLLAEPTAVVHQGFVDRLPDRSPIARHVSDTQSSRSHKIAI